MMTLAKHLNSVGDDLSVGTIDAQIRGFEGPAMMHAGPQACGASAVFQAICASRVGIHRYLNGEWIAIAEGDSSVDISPGLFIE